MHETAPRIPRRLAAAVLTLLLTALLTVLTCASCAEDAGSATSPGTRGLPAYSGDPSVSVDDGRPAFTDQERALPHGTERYGKLDRRGRCTAAFAVVGPETMPTREREGISQVKPTGWALAPYDFIDGGYLYNRCHLLGYQLTAENANERNLITGTRYLNVEGMLPYENQVASYVRRTGNHVLMRVTPLFEGGNKIASGVQMEAESLEDHGAGVRFNVYCYNVQPGIHIEYDDGSNWADDAAAPSQQGAGQGETAGESADRMTPANPPATPRKGEITKQDPGNATFVMNAGSMRFHRPTCSSAAAMSAKNLRYFQGTRERALELGYAPCGSCRP